MERKKKEKAKKKGRGKKQGRKIGKGKGNKRKMAKGKGKGRRRGRKRKKEGEGKGKWEKGKENENGEGKTQHMAGDAPHHALLYIAPLHLTYTQHMAGDAYTMLIWQVTLHTMLYRILHRYIFHTHSIWHTPCSMRVSYTTPSIFHTHDIWPVTFCTMLYHSRHLLYLPYTAGRRGVVVTRLIRSAKLLYTGPG